MVFLNKSKKVLVLGAGRVGRAIALDLSDRYDVVSVDTNVETARQFENTRVKTVNKDVTNRDALNSLLNDADLVIGALPGHLGFKVLKNVVEYGKPFVDISFCPEDPFELDKLAKSKKIAVIMDTGVAPGLSNIICGFHHNRMVLKSFTCYVGGLPKIRLWPYQYKASWSPIDVIEEYTRPARFIENGKLIVKPALSDPELIDFAGTGTLEAFNTDGLRTLLKTIKIPHMKEKTLRYPGHIEYIKVLRETGFFNNQTLKIRGVEISPLEITSRILLPHWHLAEDEEEFTIMRVLINGEENGSQVRYVYDLYDEGDGKTGLSSMARTTGFTCTAIATLFLEGEFDIVGVIPPEFIGADENKFNKIVNYLKSRNVSLKTSRVVAEK